MAQIVYYGYLKLLFSTYLLFKDIQLIVELFHLKFLFHS